MGKFFGLRDDQESRSLINIQSSHGCWYKAGSSGMLVARRDPWFGIGFV